MQSNSAVDPCGQNEPLRQVPLHRSLPRPVVAPKRPAAHSDSLPTPAPHQRPSAQAAEQSGEVRPCFAPYRPTGQGTAVAFVAPGGHQKPGLHRPLHTVAPMTGPKVPAAHGRHAASLLEPMASLNRPCGHGVVPVAAAPQKLPAGQTMHAEEELEPEAELNRPAEQGIGAAIALALQYAPGVHASHALSFVEPSLGLKLGRGVRRVGGGSASQLGAQDSNAAGRDRMPATAADSQATPLQNCVTFR